MSEERMPVKKLEEFLEYGKTHPEVFGCSGIERYFEFQQNADLKQHNEIMKAERKKWAREEADWLEKFVLPRYVATSGQWLEVENRITQLHQEAGETKGTIGDVYNKLGAG